MRGYIIFLVVCFFVPIKGFELLHDSSHENESESSTKSEIDENLFPPEFAPHWDRLNQIKKTYPEKKNAFIIEEINPDKSDQTKTIFETDDTIIEIWQNIDTTRTLNEDISLLMDFSDGFEQSSERRNSVRNDFEQILDQLNKSKDDFKSTPKEVIEFSEQLEQASNEDTVRNDFEQILDGLNGSNNDFQSIPKEVLEFHEKLEQASNEETDEMIYAIEELILISFMDALVLMLFIFVFISWRFYQNRGRLMTARGQNIAAKV